MSGLCEKCADKACPDYYYEIVECQDFQPMRNADKIRAMTDEELAVICNELCPPAGYTECPVYGDEESVSTHEICRRCWLDWLKQEVSS